MIIRKCASSIVKAPVGGFYFHSGETTDSVIQGITIQNGSMVEGGAMYCFNASFTMTNCILVDNQGSNYGGGVYLRDSSPVITNCTIVENQTNFMGGGVYCRDASPKLINCTISENAAGTYGGGLFTYGTSSTAEVVNCIFWNNTSPNGHEICLADAIAHSTVTVNYSNVQGSQSEVYVMSGCTLNWGLGMMDTDPLFVGGSPFDYHLTASSPCIDRGTGDSGTYPNLPGDDIDCDIRPMGGGIDMGSDEIPFEISCGDVLDDVDTSMTTDNVYSGACGYTGKDMIYRIAASSRPLEISATLSDENVIGDCYISPAVRSGSGRRLPCYRFNGNHCDIKRFR